MKKPTQTERLFVKRLKKNSLNSSSTSISSSSSLSPPSSLSKRLKNINNETQQKRINDSSNYIDGSKKRKRISSPSTPPSPLSASSLSPSQSPSIIDSKVKKINPSLRNLNMRVERLHEDNTLAIIADNPSQYHRNKSDSEAEINILEARSSSSSTKNTVSNGNKK